MSKTKIIIGIVIVLILLISVIVYYSRMSLESLRKKEFILSSETIGPGVVLQDRMKLHPRDDKLILYKNVVVDDDHEKKSSPIKFIVKIWDDGSIIKYPDYVDFGIYDKLAEFLPPQYTITKILGFYRISDGEKSKWVKTAPRSTFGDNIDDYKPTEAKQWKLPPPLL